MRMKNIVKNLFKHHHIFTISDHPGVKYARCCLCGAGISLVEAKKTGVVVRHRGSMRRVEWVGIGTVSGQDIRAAREVVI